MLGGVNEWTFVVMRIEFNYDRNRDNFADEYMQTNWSIGQWVMNTSFTVDYFVEEEN